MNNLSSRNHESGVTAWWNNRSSLEKWLLGIFGVASVFLLVGATAYAIVSGGVVVATTGGTVVAIGKAATMAASLA